MKWRNISAWILTLAIGLGGVSAKERDDLPASTKKNKTLAEGCSPATAQIDLDINNVRARILGSGDMWWDLNDAQYEVPKGSNKHSMFAGALWLGGLDQAEQLKLAAMTYRQRGVDYWPGPLTDDGSASVTEQTCNEYDRHWMVFRDEVETHAAWIECKEDPTCDVGERFPGYEGNIPRSIQDWPGNGINGELPTTLAPFIESDTNGIPGIYEVEWDYPAYDLNRELDCQDKEVDILYGDQTIWWVYNDKGNVHTETQGDPLGFEIRAQAFAFAANDEINNMTFNNYRIINKSTFTLSDTYFGTWFDADLGNPTDDIIGSDISRGLGYVYNGDNDDDGALGYGENPPAVGFDFFQGPFADFFNGLDDDRDGCVDGVRDENGNCVAEDVASDINERIIMSGFMYYNNGTAAGNPANTSDPDNAQEFYNYLRSLWKNGSPLVIENPSGKGATGNGDGFVQDPTGFTPTKFAYPGVSFDTTGNNDPTASIDWWESPNNLADKRGLHTAGPFILTPGALNFITTGAVWARNFQSQDLFASVNDVIIADDKAQALFDNCFEILDGPDSPVLQITEMDQELILNIEDVYTANTAFYDQVDPLIRRPDSLTPQELQQLREEGFFSYRFEGIQIFQVANSSVGVDQLYDNQLSRLVFQTDLRNDIGQLVNYTVGEGLEGNPLVPQDMTLEANNNGLDLSFTLTTDVFDGGNTLINHKEYYFYVIAYSQNQWKLFDPRSPNSGGQQTPFLAGRRIGNNQRPYIGIPHKTESEESGLDLNAAYGDLMPITRLDGVGNGGQVLRMTPESEEAILNNGQNDIIEYEIGQGPVQIFVADPKKMVNADYELRFSPSGSSFRWTLKDITRDSIVGESVADIDFIGDQIFSEIGLGVSVLDQIAPGAQTEVNNNGVLPANIEYEDPTQAWLTGVPDQDGQSPLNWIFAGTQNITTGTDPNIQYNDVRKADPSNPQASVPLDPQEHYESILGGTWTPVVFASNVDPAGNNGGFPVKAGRHSDMYPLREVPSIDVVITKDHNLWTRVPVIEMGNVAANNDGQTPQFAQRSANSLVKDAEGNLLEDPNTAGWSYFPGYAINVETGRRLHMVIGENSWLKSENGGDMLWNPSANILQRGGIGGFAMGGMHTVYVIADSIRFDAGGFGNFEDATYRSDDIAEHPFEKTGYLEDMKNNPNQIDFRNFFGNMYWCSIGLVASPEFEYESYRDIPTDARVRLRLQSPYQRTDTVNGVNAGSPLYQFSTGGFAPNRSDLSTAQRALDLIRVVPNPYFGSSAYENSQLESVVKIINLPPRANITILMPNGSVVRNISKDNTNTFVEWDLTNDFNVPIASGVYIIHIEAPGIGEKVVKWMGSLRPTDLNAF